MSIYAYITSQDMNLCAILKKKKIKSFTILNFIKIFVRT